MFFLLANNQLIGLFPSTNLEVAVSSLAEDFEESVICL